MRRKGELSPNRVDAEWPHQIVLRADLCCGKHGEAQQTFCRDLSICDRGHTVYVNDRHYRVFCFSKKEDAEKFQAAFGGVVFDPKLRARRDRWFEYRGPVE